MWHSHLNSAERERLALSGKPSKAIRTKAHAKRNAEVVSLLAAASAKLPSSPPEAAVLAETALRKVRVLGDLPLQGEAALLLGHCYLKSGDLKSADQRIAEALNILERKGKRSLLGRAYFLQAGLFSSQERVSLALAAAAKALTYPDLLPRDRASLFTIIGACLSRLFDPLTGLAAMEQRALPEADRSDEPQTIVACYSRTAATALACAFWSANIPHYLTVGMTRTDIAVSSAEYLERAMKYLLVAEAHGGSRAEAERAYFFGLKGCVIAMRDGFDSALPVFEQGHAAATDRFPRSKLALLVCEGGAARAAGRWQHALAMLSQAQREPAAHLYERTILFELSHVYRALGRADEALQTLEQFTQLQAKMARLASSWIDDLPSQRRYGAQLDLLRLRSSVLDLVDPPALKRANGYVEKNLDRRLPLSEVARHAGVSVRTLQSLYKDFRGVSASAFIRECRMQRAHRMLAAGARAVSRVTEAIGYSNPANFSRDFRRRFGCAPSDVQRESQL